MRWKGRVMMGAQEAEAIAVAALVVVVAVEGEVSASLHRLANDTFREVRPGRGPVRNLSPDPGPSPLIDHVVAVSRRIGWL
jgi:hypothetical protein